MEHTNILRQHNLFYRLSCVPEKIVSAHGTENLAEFVLYELCHPECFHFEKAAFFVDNPDFDCLRGVAGFAAEDIDQSSQDVWQGHDDFSTRMKNSEFNKQVRAFNCTSMQRNGKSIEQEVEQ